MKKEPDKQEYQQIVKNLTPKHNSLLNCAKAFVVGGVFCVLGEMMKQTMITYFGLSKKDSLLYVTIELVLLSVILTGFIWENYKIWRRWRTCTDHRIC